jgi:hypothetical protein
LILVTHAVALALALAVVGIVTPDAFEQEQAQE